MSTPPATWLTGTRTALLLDLGAAALPVVRHWGPAPRPEEAPATVAAVATPAQTQSSVDARLHLDLCPGHATGYQGSPGLVGAFGDGTGWAPRWRRTGLTVDDRSVVVAVADPDVGLGLHVELRIDEHDVVALRASVTNQRDEAGADLADPVAIGAARPANDATPSTGDASDAARAATAAARFPVPTPGLGAGADRSGVDPASLYHLGALRLTVPIPDDAREIATFTGRWIRELHLQRQPWDIGRIARSNARGRSSHEDPPTMFAGSAGFSEESGCVRALHLAWAGNHELLADRHTDGYAYVQVSEFLHPGEIMLAPGETYVTPWLLGAASTTGLNGVSDAFHAHVRARPNHPTRPRPVTLNTWEAVYFDHAHDRLEALIDVAAELGIERFVLDDGWFAGRDDDTSSLGDWIVDDRKHPGGLRPLAERVRAAGLEFGLWVEPEMVNPDSERFRADPSVALAQPGGPTNRHQLVLDLAREDVWRSVRDQLLAVLEDAQPAYLKWDHNRQHAAPDRAGRAAAHVQVAAAYALLDELQRARPGLEVESCASGGGRIDLGILAHTHRFWTSDTNDPVERQTIQRGTSYLFPPELMGAHVGGPLSHTTARVSGLPLRLCTAFFGHLGVEWDVTTAAPEERARLADAITLHKRWRDVLHGGRVVRVDHPDPAGLVHGVVTPERGVFAYVQLATSDWSRPAAVRCPGFPADGRYRVEILWPLTSDLAPQHHQPGWYAAGEVVVSGDALATVGVQLHAHQPQAATVLAFTRVA
jgi:alpha-galactosidase